MPARLGFRPLAEPTIDVGGQTLYSVLLDMGPGSVDAWLTELVGAEITAEDIESSRVLDVEAHELISSSGRCELQPSSSARLIGHVRLSKQPCQDALLRCDLKSIQVQDVDGKKQEGKRV